MLLAKRTSYKDMWYYANCDFGVCIIWFLFLLSEKKNLYVLYSAYISFGFLYDLSVLWSNCWMGPLLVYQFL